jgi:fluoride exporter
MDLLIRITCVGAAGALGALARWGMTWLVEAIAGRRWLEQWPLATLTVNGLGCFAFGCCFEVLRHHGPQAEIWRLIVLVGFLGAFTTYSTFAFDTYRMHTEHSIAAALSYVALQIMLGWGAFLAGLYLGRIVV